MHSCEDIEENRCFSNGGTNLHIHAIAQGRPEDNQVEFLQGPHGIVNPPKNLVLNNICRFTQMANGLVRQLQSFYLTTTPYIPCHSCHYGYTKHRVTVRENFCQSFIITACHDDWLTGLWNSLCPRV